MEAFIILIFAAKIVAAGAAIAIVVSIAAAFPSLIRDIRTDMGG
jgi:hypothetical protein